MSTGQLAFAMSRLETDSLSARTDCNGASGFVAEEQSCWVEDLGVTVNSLGPPVAHLTSPDKCLGADRIEKM